MLYYSYRIREKYKISENNHPWRNKFDVLYIRLFSENINNFDVSSILYGPSSEEVASAFIWAWRTQQKRNFLTNREQCFHCSPRLKKFRVCSAIHAQIEDLQTLSWGSPIQLWMKRRYCKYFLTLITVLIRTKYYFTIVSIRICIYELFLPLMPFPHLRVFWSKRSRVFPNFDQRLSPTSLCRASCTREKVHPSRRYPKIAKVSFERISPEVVCRPNEPPVDGSNWRSRMTLDV